MEQIPQSEENNEPERPVLSLDLSGPDGNVYAVISHARGMLEDDELEIFRQEIQAATAPDASKTYEDILAIVHSHVELIDRSNSYPEYGNESRVTAAVEQLNEQILTLPDTTPCQIDGVYPEFDDSDYSPEKYMIILRFEISRIESDIERSSGDQREALEKYRAMLHECAVALRRAGVM